MKRFLFVFLFLTGLAVHVSAQSEVAVELTCEKIGGGALNSPMPRTPLARPTLTLDGYTLYIGGAQRDYTLQLVDEDGDVVYEVFLPAGTTSFLLPTCYAGAYRLNLLWSDWCFWGYVEL